MRLVLGAPLCALIGASLYAWGYWRGLKSGLLRERAAVDSEIAWHKRLDAKLTTNQAGEVLDLARVSEKAR